MTMATSYQPTRNSSNEQIAYIGRELRYISSSVAECGVTLKLHTDFKLFKEVASKIPDRGSITALFDPDKSSIGPHNGFWIEGTDESGQIVHLQAVKMNDFQDISLASHWRANPHLYAPAGDDVVLQKSNFNTAEIAHEMSGRICYHGELWIHKSCRKFRLSPILSKFAMMLAFAKFSPDYIYCFIVPKHIKQGLAAVHGYLHIHPWGPQWYIRGSGELHDDYLVWITAQELRELWTTGQRDTQILSFVREDSNRVPSTVQSVARH
jgi:hypothetical protein